MAATPTPRSRAQIVGELVDAFLARQGIPALKSIAPLASILEAAGQSDFRSSSDIFQFLTARDLFQADDADLEAIGSSEGVDRLPALAATTTVTIGDSNFSKISSRVSEARPAPIAGSTAVDVVDASEFPASGTVYIGRGGLQAEGPLSYSSKADNGTYWTLTLSGATGRFHNVNEEVVVGQGGARTIGAGTIVQTAQGSAAPAVKFDVRYSATIPDGEVEVEDVQVACRTPGTAGNVDAGGINSFDGLPFPTATVTNPRKVATGRAREPREKYLERIINTRASRSKGTPLALTIGAVDVQAPDEDRRVTSATHIRGIGTEPSVLYIDDGTGYEETVEGVAQESIVDSASGGEQNVRLARRPVAKARLVTTLSAPFLLVDGSVLAIKVGGTAAEHTFSAAEFTNIGNGSGYEVAASINADTALTWEARTEAAGSRVVIFAKTDTNEDLQVTTPSGVGVTDANDYLGFPSTLAYSLRLYEDDRLLSKDGSRALVRSAALSRWQALSGSQTLIIGADSTPVATYTFTNQSFIDADTGFTTVGINSVAAWAAVIQAAVPGITAEEVDGRAELSSNLGASDRARIKITGGTLVTAGMFEVSDVSGTTADYQLRRGTGDIKLAGALAEGSKLSAGTSQTRAFVQSGVLAPTTLSAAANLWLGIDATAAQVAHGASAATAIAVTTPAVEPWGHRLRIASAAGHFSNLAVRDWAMIWDSAFDDSLAGAHAVARVASDGSYFEVDRRSMNHFRGEATATVLADGRVLVCGGWSNPVRRGTTRTCEVFDPGTGLWTSTGSMSTGRAGHTATLLASGKVFVFGGQLTSADSSALQAGETWDPATDLWTAVSTTSAPVARHHHAACLGPDDKVYVAGGFDAAGNEIATMSVYDPAGDTWTSRTAITAAKACFTFDKLSDDLLYAVAGQSGGAVVDTAYAYDTSANSWAGAGTVHEARQSHRSVVLNNGKLLIAGGSTAIHSAAVTASKECDQYEVGVGWATTTDLNKARAYFGLCKLSGGRVVAGFGDQAASTPYAEISDDATATAWTNLADPSGAFPRRRCPAVSIGTNTALFVGGLNSGSREEPRASTEAYVLASVAWSTLDPAIAASVTLADSGLEIARLAQGRPVLAQVASGTNYTASTLADALQTALEDKGAAAATYRTSQLRLSTLTRATEASGWSGRAGDVKVIGADTDAQLLDLPDTLVDNLDGHLGSVESGNPEIGTPTFQRVWARGRASTILSAAWSNNTMSAATQPTSGHQVVGLGSLQDSTTLTRSGDSYAHRSAFKTREWDSQSGGLNYLDLRSSPDIGWIPDERCYFASPYSFGPDDEVAVVADQDEDQKRYVHQMYRKVIPTGSYASTITLRDNALASPQSLALAFGLSYDWSDFAVMMRARVLTHSADASKRVLWRWWRWGKEGESAQVAYGLPAGPDDAVTVSVDDDTADTTSVKVLLAGGAQKTGVTLRPWTHIGVAATSSSSSMATVAYVLGFSISSAERTTNVTELTLTLPGAVTNHGLQTGDAVWVQSSSAFFASGLYTITGVSATTIEYTETDADQGATADIGTVSFDTQEADFTTASPSLSAGDFFRLESSSGIHANFEDQTIRVTSSGDQFLIGKYENFAGMTSTTLTWYTLTDVDAFVLFANPGQTATVIAAAVNALATAGTSPISGTVTGTGSGTITQSSSEEAAVADTYFALVDGQNYVKSQVDPASTSQNYQFVLKDSINSGLSSNSDWTSEDVRLVPLTAASVASWLQQQGVSGLSSAIDVDRSSNGAHVQLTTKLAGTSGSVEVQDGSANSWSASVAGAAEQVSTTHLLLRLPASLKDGFGPRSWCTITASSPSPKAVFVSTSKLTSWTAAGRLTFNSGGAKVWDAAATAVAGGQVIIERHGAFICIAASGSGTSISLTGVDEGDWVRLAAPATPTGGVTQIADANVGLYRVVRVETSSLDNLHSLWIVNDTAVEQLIAECDLKFIVRDSVLPGDKLTISTTLWGADNRGIWTVKKVGDAGSGDFTNNYCFDVEVEDKVPVPVSPGVDLGSDSVLVRVEDALAPTWYKQLHSMVPDPDDSSLVRAKFNADENWDWIGASVGSVVTAMDKLAFPAGVWIGADAYQYSTGLVGEVARVMWGDPADTATYPGVAADGSNLDVRPPKIRRGKISLGIRLQSSAPPADTIAAVRSAVAAKYNSQPHGRSFAVGLLVGEAQAVPGVHSAVPLTTFTAGNDLVIVRADEKAQIFDTDSDVGVSLIGS